jgi:stress-induced morphogen
VTGVDTLRGLLEQAFPDATEVSVVDRTGGGDHFQVTVTSTRFDGLPLLEQHKLVYGVFGDEVGGPIHALSIKTSTPTGDPAR